MKDNNEIRFIHREETFTDLAVRELAESCAACLCRLQFKRCTEDECENCQEGIGFRRCYNQMSDYDRQRFSTYLRQAYARNAEHPEMWRTFKGLVGHAILWILGFFAAFFFIGFFLSECDKPNRPIKDSYASITKEMHSKVSNNIRYTSLNIFDVTADGKKNCQDYSILFYLYWQDRFPEDKDRVFFVRNKNPYNGMNHLFIYMIDYDGRGFYLEPWADVPTRYLMFDSWTSRYNPKYNEIMPAERYLERAVNAVYRRRYSKEPK
ncbi:MAG: hypothetical protein J5798_07675 [Spirochaetaceae bacterium]|nr:hypothetical protein [Spirochaetaceae bacterium]